MDSLGTVGTAHLLLAQLHRFLERETPLVKGLAHNHAVNAALAHTPESSDVLEC